MNKLLFRMIASKISYPANMLNVLVTNDTLSENIDFTYANIHFDHILTLNELNDLINIIKKSGPKSKNSQLEIMITQQKLYERFSILYTENLRFLGRKKEFNNIELNLDAIEAKKSYVQKYYNENERYIYKSDMN